MSIDHIPRMRIEHVALWTDDLDRLADFYRTYFDAKVGELYSNAAKGFESRFLSFDSGAHDFAVSGKASPRHATYGTDPSRRVRRVGGSGQRADRAIAGRRIYRNR